MKEAIGGTWLFQIVIVFIFLFAGYMCLSINHSKAFSIKSELIESISRHGGIDQEEIAGILSKASYRTRGSCRRFNDNTCSDDSCWVGYNREGRNVGNDNSATFCVRKVNVGNLKSAEDKNTVDELPDMYYYQVRVFYQLDLPIFNSIFSFTVRGDTTLLYRSDIIEKGAGK